MMDKHGIGFREAEALWEDPDRIVLAARSVDEPRFLLIAKKEKGFWSAVYTLRRENIRIIPVRKSRKKDKKSIKASEFDKKFDEGESILEYLDFKSITKPGNTPKRVGIDFPEWMVMELDRTSKKLGVTRQSLIKVIISEKLREGRI